MPLEDLHPGAMNAVYSIIPMSCSSCADTATDMNRQNFENVISVERFQQKHFAASRTLSKCCQILCEG